MWFGDGLAVLRLNGPGSGSVYIFLEQEFWIWGCCTWHWVVQIRGFDVSLARRLSRFVRGFGNFGFLEVMVWLFINCFKLRQL